MAVMEDRLHIVDIEKAVLPWRCILWTGELSI